MERKPHPLAPSDAERGNPLAPLSAVRVERRILARWGEFVHDVLASLPPGVRPVTLRATGQRHAPDGAAWKFLRLRGDVLAVDRPEYYIDNLPQVMGVLKLVVESR